MINVYKLSRSLVGASLGLVSSGCTSAATAVIVAVDTDIPPERPMMVNVRVQRGQGSVGASLQWVRGRGGVEFPLSFTVTPLLAAHRVQAVQIDFTVEIPARDATEPTIRFNRMVRFSYTPSRTGIVRVFLPLRCGERAIGCPPGDMAQCTVARLCELAGLTCGNSGECVDSNTSISNFDRDAEFVSQDVASDVLSDSQSLDVPNELSRDSSLLDSVDARPESDVLADTTSSMDADVPERFDVGTDSGFDASFDARGNDGPDSCVRNCAGRNCGPDGCGGVCGPACSSQANAVGVCSGAGVCGIQCNASFANCDGNLANGCEVNLQTDRNHCGACVTPCAMSDACVAGRCVAPACAGAQVGCGGVCYTPGAPCGAGMCPVFGGVSSECQAGLPGCGFRCDFGVVVCGTVGAEGRACGAGLGVCRENGRCGCGAGRNMCVECAMCQVCGQAC